MNMARMCGSTRPAWRGAGTSRMCFSCREGWTRRIAQYREILRINPHLARAHANLSAALLRRGEMAEAIREAGEALELAPADTASRNRLAWLLATARPDSLRDGPRAVALIEESAEGKQPADPMMLRTLAAAHAQAGHFPQAAAVCRAALQCPGAEPALVLELNRELRLYEANSAFREAP